MSHPKPKHLHFCCHRNIFHWHFKSSFKWLLISLLRLNIFSSFFQFVVTCDYLDLLHLDGGRRRLAVLKCKCFIFHINIFQHSVRQKLRIFRKCARRFYSWQRKCSVQAPLQNMDDHKTLVKLAQPGGPAASSQPGNSTTTTRLSLL